MEDPLGVYVHIPYCASKCPYCDFNSVAAGAPPGAGAQPNAPVDEHRYVECLLRELSGVAGGAGVALRRLASFYIGGGTPTVFSTRALKRVIRGVLGAFAPPGPSQAPPEITVEVNPGTIGAAGLKGLKEAGVNRLSIGVQSFSDRVLASLGRSHTAGRTEQVYNQARGAGFDNIGVDLIFGVPGHTPGEWDETLKTAVGLAPEHVSVYGLTIEDSTPFGRIYGSGRGAAGRAGALTGDQRLPGEGAVVKMYASAVEALKGAGYVHYEISNFALPGRRSVHNTRYWQGGDYLGLGAGAHTYLAGAAPWGFRAWNVRGPDEYMRSVEAGGSARAGCEELTRQEAMTESVMLGLRMLENGMDGTGFRRRFGQYPKEALPGFRALEEEGLIRASGEDLLLTPRGVVLSDEVFVRVL